MFAQLDVKKHFDAIHHFLIEEQAIGVDSLYVPDNMIEMLINPNKSLNTELKEKELFLYLHFFNDLPGRLLNFYLKRYSVRIHGFS